MCEKITVTTYIYKDKNKSSFSCRKKLKEADSVEKDWEKKYDVTLPILNEEYLQCLQRIRNVDEKANKYFVVISVLMAGFFVVLSSSTIEGLEFDYLKSIYSFLMTLLFILTFIASIYFGVLIFKPLLSCFKLVETRRMPDLKELLANSENESCSQYKDGLITCYQDSINLMNEAIIKKQLYIRFVSEKIEVFIGFLFLSLTILIILKILGLSND